MAKTFNELQRSRIAEGLFLSSGIAGGGVRTQDRLIDTIDVLRNQLNYRGYVHLKIMPGTERDQVYRAMQLSDRIRSTRSAQLAPPGGLARTRLHGRTAAAALG
jgi:predicted DNA-binding helix-hairpin-helix protein